MAKYQFIVGAFVTALIFPLFGIAQQIKTLPPSGLMCDLIENAGNYYVNGYLVNSTPAHLADESVQTSRIASKQPSFSWITNSLQPNAIQTAYQVLVSDSPLLLERDNGNIWDSGKVLSPQSAGITFGGKPLSPNTAYYWKVRTWVGHDEPGPYAAPCTFFTAQVLKEHQTPGYPLQITEQQPLTINSISKNYVADFGRDAFSQLKLKLFSEKGSDTITIHLGETINADGNINRKPGGSIYYGRYAVILEKGWHSYKINLIKNAYNTRPGAILMPAYIGEVVPFRYCEIANYQAPLTNANLTRLAVNYHFDDAASDFTCSDSALNAVWNLCKYSVKATSFLGMYVDGNRERTPYEADALINQLSHYAVDREYTLARNSHEYLITHPTWPTEWILQSVLIAWNDYLYTGDISSARYYYKDLKAKTLIALADSTSLISTLNRRMTKQVLDDIHHSSGTLKDIVDWPRPSESDGFVFTRYNAVVNAFYYRALILMGKLAGDLGKSADSEMFRQKAGAVKLAYQKMFYNKARKIYVDGNGTDHASLHANAFALALGLVDKRSEKPVADFITSKGMACSVYGSQFLLDGLYDAGEDEYALALMTSTGDRSWLNMMRLGSTITLEAWDNKFKPNLDWNHAWGTAPANIISRKLMGIEPLTPGWSSFSIHPRIGNLGEAAIDVPTIKGTIRVAYKQTGETFHVDMDIPANTLASVYIPAKGRRYVAVEVDGRLKRVKAVGKSAFAGIIGSGKHILSVHYRP